LTITDQKQGKSVLLHKIENIIKSTITKVYVKLSTFAKKTRCSHHMQY